MAFLAEDLTEAEAKVVQQLGNPRDLIENFDAIYRRSLMTTALDFFKRRHWR